MTANRHQTYFITPNDQVSADNAVRLMDTFRTGGVFTPLSQSEKKLL